MIIKYKIDKNINCLDFLQSNGYSRNIIITLKKSGILINGHQGRCDHDLNKGDIVEITIPEEESLIPISDKEISIIYEDEYILVVYKEANLATIPTKAHYIDSLAGRVLNYYRKINLKQTIHFVNRLDFITRGLVLIAKNQYIHSLFRNIEIEKKYFAKVVGELKSGMIVGNIARGEGMKRIVSPDGKYSKTEYNVISFDGVNSIVDIKLHTGRTHQIRVHFSYIGHPLCGDDLYGAGQGEFYLESYYIGFNHPISKKYISLKRG